MACADASNCDKDVTQYIIWHAGNGMCSDRVDQGLQGRLKIGWPIVPEQRLLQNCALSGD